MEALGTKARTLAQINQEENEEKLRELPGPSQTISYFLLYKDYTNIMKDYYERRYSNWQCHYGHILWEGWVYTAFLRGSGFRGLRLLHRNRGKL
jgi:hypothetical protein